MRLKDYLSAREESEVRFSKRVSVAQATINGICKGKGCRLKTARKIVLASRSEPAPCGGTVTYDDLLPEAPVSA